MEALTRTDRRAIAALFAGLLTCVAPAAAVAQAQPVPGTAAMPDPAQQAVDVKMLAQLFDNVHFWIQKGQPDAARAELERVLVLAPRDPDAVALAARLSYQIGQSDAGDRYRSRLRAIAPGDPRLPSLDAERPMTAAEKQQLDQARSLAAAGRRDEALAAYRQVFSRGIPDSLSVEYYLALGTSSADGFQQAMDGITQAGHRWPGDFSFKLAAAELQTYRESTRGDGIDALRELSHVPSVASAAKAAWRDALLWQGPEFRTRDQINAYLAENATDPAIQAKVKELQDSLPDAGVLARLRGYEAHASRQYADAELDFQTALTSNPDDADALAMISLYRRMHGKQLEANELVAHALRVAPERRDELIKIIGYDPDNPPAWILRDGSSQADEDRMNAAAAAAANAPARPAYRGDGGAAIRRGYAQVKALSGHGEFAAAEAALRKLMGPHPQTASFNGLGYLQLQAGQLTEAEASFQRVLAAKPRDSVALGGLAGVYARQGRDAEAAAIYARLGSSRADGFNQTRVAALRAQAQATGDVDDKLRLYREAVAIDGNNPWLRLEYARVLSAAHRQAEARSVMAGVGMGPKPTVDQLQAGLVWAQEHDDLARVDQLVAALPAKQRTQQILDLQARSEVALAVEQAQAAGSPLAVRSSLIAIAAHADPAGTRGQAVAQALIRSGDKAAVREAVRAGLANTPQPTTAQRLAYAAALSQAGFSDDARTLLRQVSPAALPPSSRTAYNGLADGLAIQHSDQLSAEGKRADAFDALSPRLRADPDSTGVNLAVSRLYAADGKPKQALQVAEGALQRSPADLDAVRATVDAALQASDLGRARQLSAQAAASQPDDPRTYLIQADIARSRGENGVALTALRKARSLRQQQLSAP